MTLVAICVAIPQRMRLFDTVVEIWHMMGSRPWNFGVTWRHRLRAHSTPWVDFLWVAHSDHASI